MRVLIISGTAHKGSGYNIGRMTAEKLAKPEEIDEVFLPRDFDEFCCGCTNCFTKGEDTCPHYGKLRPITELIDAADVLILTSPVYVYHCTGQMKALLDHYGWRWMAHRPEEKMFRKQAVVISTAAGAGVKSAMKDMADSCFFWGIPKTYKLGRPVAATDWESVKPKVKESIGKKADSIAKKILKRQGNVPVPLKTKAFFKIMSLMQRNGWNKADMDYWKAKGWTESKRPWK
ncbi:MAG: NAD(P)H-dependent oxidoreductase [Ruminococcus sp.]|uniref:NAD(P)H-dependent oxidoreductase n=1 Tax=Ruminococcus sp. TaxID=41978 RepID=UPI0025EA495D|nr:NAD(P)H-dependent oxidoreductase [Ruminococcus sp.]MBR6995241.1 NAD(P)H-dependent oxidoreductase [Ruminococcus sp.]